jgi:hypothetical protein
MLRDQVRLKLSFHLISGVARANRPAEEIVEERAARAAAVKAVADGHVPDPFDGDAKSERRLATLLWRWTNQKIDLKTFMHCDDNAADIGVEVTVCDCCVA